MLKSKNIIMSIFVTFLVSIIYIPITKAQTCTPAPNCDTLGYTMSLSDCGTLEHIKCPFDLSKVYCNKYCSNGHKNGAWVVGEYYYDKDGNNLGIISETDGTHGIIVSLFSKNATYDDAVDFCEKQTVGGLMWTLIAKKQLQNFCKSNFEYILDVDVVIQEKYYTFVGYGNCQSNGDVTFSSGSDNTKYQTRCMAAF